MKKRKTLQIYKILLLIMFLFSLLVIGCKKKPESTMSDKLVLHMLGNLKTSSVSKFKDITEQVDHCISLWENEVLDAKPTLFFAAITKHGTDTVFNLYTYDEDKDIMGIRIQEEYIGEDGSKENIDEKYPVFESMVFKFVVGTPWCFFKIRDDLSVKKDEEKWKVWREAVESNSQEFLEKYENNEELIPRAYASIPVPGKVDVWISVYDRAGNESESIKLYNLLKGD